MNETVLIRYIKNPSQKGELPMKQSNQKAYDPSIIRLQLRIEDFRFRGPVISTERLRDVKKVLLTFHTLETMTAYKFGYLL